MDKLRIKTSKEELKELATTTQHGVFNSLHEEYKMNFTYKPGFFTIVAGPPASGKTDLVFKEVMTFIERDDAKVLIFSPETGTKGEVIAQFMTVRVGGTIYEGSRDRITEEQMDEFLDMYNDNLFVIDDDGTNDGYSIEDIFKISDELSKEVGHIDYIVVDNLNDIKEPPVANGRQDLALEKMYVDIRRHCRKSDNHLIAVTHSSNQGKPAEIKTAKGLIRYYPPITVREIRGGEANHRKGYNIITLWRPVEGLECPITGREYDNNETHIRVLKAKPKGAAIAHSTAVMFYNPKFSSLQYLNPNLSESEAKSQRNMIKASEGPSTTKRAPMNNKSEQQQQEEEIVF